MSDKKKSFILAPSDSTKKQKIKQPSNQQLKKGRSLQSKTSQNKKSITKQIDTLMQRINQANDNIKSTQKLLNIDLFLKTQKQKRLEYAKKLNQEYEAQKKNRQQKLYKKYKKEQKGQRGQKGQKGQQIIKDKKIVGIPLDIMKVFNINNIKLKTIINSHLLNDDNIPKLTRDQIYEEQSTLYCNNNLENVTLRKINQIAKNSLDIKIFPIILTQSEILPSQEGQNLLNAACFLCYRGPNFSQAHYSQQNINNTELIFCKFYDFGNIKTTITISEILVRQFTHKYVNINSQVYSGDNFWPSILQKSYKLLKYQSNPTTPINLYSINETIYDLCGIDPQTIQFSNKNLILENIPIILYNLLKDNTLIGFYNKSINNNIYKNRIYPLIDVINQTISKNKVQYQYRIGNFWRGKLLSNDNKNIFTILQLCQLFDHIIILKDYPKKWECLRILVSYFSMGGVSSLNNQWTKNNQYTFTVLKDMYMRIILRNIKKVTLKSQKQYSNYGFLMFKNPQNDTHISCMKIDNLIVKTKCIEDGIGGIIAQYSSFIPKGNYIIIPYTNQVSNKEYFFYYLDFIVERKDGIAFGKARFIDYTIQNVNGQTKIQNKQKFNKPKIEQLIIPTLPKLTKQQSKVTVQKLNSFKIILEKDCKIQHFEILGKLSSLLINKNIVQPELKPKKLQNNKTHNLELQKCQRQQNLQILLGYDTINDNTNMGKLRDIIYQSQDIIDLANYQLGQQGLIATLGEILNFPKIRKINLYNNQLNDQSVVYLCYYLDKSNRVQLEQINLGKNPQIGNVGKDALKGLTQRLLKLKIKGLGEEKRRQKK